MKIPALKDLLRVLHFEKNRTEITIKDNSEPFEVRGTPMTVPYLPLATYLSVKVIKVRDYPTGDKNGIEIVVPDNLTYQFENSYFCPDLDWVLSTFEISLFRIRIDANDGETVKNLYSGEYREIEYFAIKDYLKCCVNSIDTDNLDTDGNPVLTITVREYKWN